MSACQSEALEDAGDEAAGPGRVARQKGRRPGLAYYHQTSTNPKGTEVPRNGAFEGLSECPNRAGMVMLDYASGMVRPARCTRLGCVHCVVVEARIRAAAIWLANPRRAIRVSLVADAGEADPWPIARRRMNRTREHYARLTGQELGEWVYSVEPNPKGTGFHAHAWQHGPSKVNAVALDRAAKRAGAGWCKVETVRSRASAASYGLKGIGGMGYGLKGADEDSSEYLRVNGGRLTHQSRAFFRSEAGATVAVRQAESEALRALFGDREPGRWAVVSESAARSWVSLPRAGGSA